MLDSFFDLVRLEGAPEPMGDGIGAWGRMPCGEFRIRELHKARVAMSNPLPICRSHLNWIWVVHTKALLVRVRPWVERAGPGRPCRLGERILDVGLIAKSTIHAVVGGSLRPFTGGRDNTISLMMRAPSGGMARRLRLMWKPPSSHRPAKARRIPTGGFV
jgi:hypothetical protein